MIELIKYFVSLLLLSCCYSLPANNYCETLNTETCEIENSWDWIRTPSFLAKFNNASLKQVEVGGLESGCSNDTLLKLTLESLGVLEGEVGSWVEFLSQHKNTLECREKVREASCLQTNCGVLCPNYCTNVVRGCLGKLVPLQSAWKHALNSVRTAARLLAVESSCKVVSLLEVTNAWGNLREPLQLLEDSVCSPSFYSNNCAFPHNNQTNTLTTYEKEPALWTSRFNPEFGFLDDNINSENFNETSIMRETLVLITRNLEIYWPSKSNDNSNTLKPEEEEYEGEEEEEYDDEEDYSGSGGGNHRNSFETDDEDLLNNNFGSGSGPIDQENNESNVIDIIPTTKKTSSSCQKVILDVNLLLFTLIHFI